MSAARGVPLPTLEVERFDLDCGARLLVSPRPGAPICALHVHFAGAFAEDPLERAGTAFLTGALAPEGTRARTEAELADALEPFGGSLSGDSGGLTGAIHARHWSALVDVLTEVVRDPTYPRAVFERRRDALVDRLMAEEDDPRVRGARRFRELVYGDHFLGRPERGNQRSVESIERRHLAAFHRRVWVARRATFALCGDVDPERAAAAIDRRLRGWREGRAGSELDERFPRPRRRVAVHNAARQQVHLYLGHLGMRRTDPDFAAVAVLDHVLGTGAGFTNRIARRLRDEEGLAYSVSAAQHDSAGRLPGLFTAYIGTSPAKVPQAVRGLVEEIRRIREELVGEEELSLARDALVGSHALGFERARARANYLLFADRLHLPDDELESLPRRYAAVSAEDVQRAAQRHLRPEELCLVGAGPVRRADLSGALEAALR